MKNKLLFCFVNNEMMIHRRGTLDGSVTWGVFYFSSVLMKQNVLLSDGIPGV
jgi:hypothetical protein